MDALAQYSAAPSLSESRLPMLTLALTLTEVPSVTLLPYQCTVR